MTITDENRRLIKPFVDELLKWNSGMNLIGSSTEQDVWQNHIRDSLELYPFLNNDDCTDIIDIGSGGGMPAVPLSLLLPSKKFYITEVDSKKLAFLEFVVKKLSLNAEVIDINGGFSFSGRCVIVSRAFSKVKNIMKWAGLHAPGCTTICLLKGRSESLGDEIKEALIRDYEIKTLEKGTILKIRMNGDGI